MKFMELSKLLLFTDKYDIKRFGKDASKSDVLNHIGESFEQELCKKYYRYPKQGRIAQDLIEREDIVSTGIGCGIAFPNAKIMKLSKPHIGIYSLPADSLPDEFWEPIDYIPVRLIIPIIAPYDLIKVHLNIIAKLSYLMGKKEYRERMLDATNFSRKETDMETINSILDSEY